MWHDLYYLVDLDSNLFKFETKQEVFDKLGEDFEKTPNILIGMHGGDNKLYMGFVKKIKVSENIYKFYSINLEYFTKTKAPDRRKFLTKTAQAKPEGIKEFLDDVILKAYWAYQDAANHNNRRKRLENKMKIYLDKGIIYLSRRPLKIQTGILSYITIPPEPSKIL